LDSKHEPRGAHLRLIGLFVAVSNLLSIAFPGSYVKPAAGLTATLMEQEVMDQGDASDHSTK
jgi:hypothetical protein